MSKTKRTKKEISEIKNFIASLILNRHSEIEDSGGKTSVQKIINLIKEEIGYSLNWITARGYIDSLDTLNYQYDSSSDENARMKEIDAKIKIAKLMADDENLKEGLRLKALNTYRGLFNEKSKYEAQLAEQRVKQMEVNKPNYLCGFKNELAVCPKCGYDFSEEEKDEENTTQKKFQAENGQSTLL